MPRELRAHRRYPRGLFASQMRMLQRYQSAPPEFVTQAAWRLGRVPSNSAPEATLQIAQPDYVLLPSLKRADKKRAAFALQEVLLSPPSAPDAILQIVRADCDGDNYGQLSAARFALTGQAARSATHVLAERAADAKTGTSFGEPLLIALGPTSGSGPLLAFQPVFKTASNSTPLETAPETLSGVVVRDLLSDNPPGFGSSAAQALQMWRTHSTGAASVAGEEKPNDLARQALRLHDQAQRAASGQDAGGWQRAGRLWKQEREVLRRLAERQNR